MNSSGLELDKSLEVIDEKSLMAILKEVNSLINETSGGANGTENENIKLDNRNSIIDLVREILKKKSLIIKGLISKGSIHDLSNESSNEEFFDGLISYLNSLENIESIDIEMLKSSFFNHRKNRIINRNKRNIEKLISAQTNEENNEAISFIRDNVDNPWCAKRLFSFINKYPETIKNIFNFIKEKPELIPKLSKILFKVDEKLKSMLHSHLEKLYILLDKLDTKQILSLFNGVEFDKITIFPGEIIDFISLFIVNNKDASEDKGSNTKEENEKRVNFCDIYLTNEKTPRDKTLNKLYLFLNNVNIAGVDTLLENTEVKDKIKLIISYEGIGEDMINRLFSLINDTNIDNLIILLKKIKLEKIVEILSYESTVEGMKIFIDKVNPNILANLINQVNINNLRFKLEAINYEKINALIRFTELINGLGATISALLINTLDKDIFIHIFRSIKGIHYIISLFMGQDAEKKVKFLNNIDLDKFNIDKIESIDNFRKFIEEVQEDLKIRYLVEKLGEGIFGAITDIHKFIRIVNRNLTSDIYGFFYEHSFSTAAIMINCGDEEEINSMIKEKNIDNVFKKITRVK